jgi:integrase
MIAKTDSGKYSVRIHHKGRQIAMRTFVLKKDATTWETEQKRQLQLGSWVNPRAGDISLDTLIAEFNASRRGAVAAHTWATDEANLRHHFPTELQRRPVALIAPHDLDDVFLGLLRTRNVKTGRIMSRATVSRVRNSFSSLFSWAEGRGIISMNPVTKTTLPKGTGTDENRIRPFSDTDLDNVILKAAEYSTDYAHAIEFLALTGIRWGELAALRVSAVIDGLDAAIIVSRSKSSSYDEKETKNGKTRRVPLIDRAAEIAAAHSAGKAPDDLLFCGARGGQLHGRNFVRAVHWAEIAPRHRVQDLRHTAATSWLRDGVDIKTVSTWLGHSDTSVTLRVYIHWMGTSSDRAGIEQLRAAKRRATAA